MRAHDQIWDDAEDEPPFSNGTEGEIWMSRWCEYPCKKDRDEDCPIVMVAYMGRTPKEWKPAEDEREAHGRYTCTEFEPDDDHGGEDESVTPEPDPPIVGQVDMFEVFTDQFVTQVAKELQPA